jgi:hypothetical protein
MDHRPRMIAATEACSDDGYFAARKCGSGFHVVYARRAWHVKSSTSTVSEISFVNTEVSFAMRRQRTSTRRNRRSLSPRRSIMTDFYSPSHRAIQSPAAA